MKNCEISYTYVLKLRHEWITVLNKLSLKLTKMVLVDFCIMRRKIFRIFRKIFLIFRE